MFKFITSLILISFISLSSAQVLATTKKKKKKSHSLARLSRKSRKSRRFHHHGNGPDLKAITTESPYKEAPTNGINPLESN